MPAAKKPKSLKKTLLVLVVLVVVLATASAGTELLGALSVEQEAKMQEVSDLTKQEIELMRQEFADLDANEDALHASAPEEKTWIGRLIDEIARWFGLI